MEEGNTGSESGGRARYATGLLTVSTKLKPGHGIINGHQEADVPFSPVHASVAVHLPHGCPMAAPRLPHDYPTTAPRLHHDYPTMHACMTLCLTGGEGCGGGAVDT